MPRDLRMYLHDIREAIRIVHQCADSRSFDDYQSDPIIRSAAERQFEIIGEAIRQMFDLAPEIESQISDARRIIDFRNILAHGYHTVRHEVVWDIIQTNIPRLEEEIERLITQYG